MTDKILNPVIARMLKEMERVFQLHSVDFYLVGAVARDIQLSSKPGYGAIRGTGKSRATTGLLTLYTKSPQNK